MDNQRYRFLGIKFRFENEPWRQKLLLHVSFWLLFLGTHLLYFVPAFKSELLTSPLRAAYLLHYFRMIPIFYCYGWIFNNLKNKVKPFFLYALSFCAAILLMHLVTTLNFLLLDSLFGLENLSAVLFNIGNLYLRQLHGDGSTMMSIFFYDIVEMQLLYLPVGLKMAKYGNRQNALKLSAENELIHAELQNLRGTLSPHLIFNLINAAYAQIEPVSKESAFYLRKLSELLRYAVYDTKQETILLADEMQSIHSYLELEKMRRGVCPQISYNQHGNIELHHTILSLILFTMTENAFKHSAGSPPGSNWIRIELWIEKAGIRFQIRNSKLAETLAPEKKKYAGIGLLNIRRILEHNFPGRYQLQTTDHGSSFEMDLFMPFVPTARDEPYILT